MPKQPAARTQSPESVTALLRKLASDYSLYLKKRHANNLVAVILFGSASRGDATPQSDIDLLAVFRELPAGRMARHAYLGEEPPSLAKRLTNLHKRGIHTDFNVMIKTVTEAQIRTPFTYELAQDGVTLADANGFFSELKADVKKRMRELGSRWRHLGKFRYLDLKPDIQPGEIFEL